jgi:heme exporter protein B
VIAAAVILASKDIRLELRRREVVLGMLQFVIATLVVVHFALGGDRTPAKPAAGMLWVVILFTALLSLGRAFAADTEDGAIDLLLLAPIDRSAIWLSKVLSQLAFLATMEVVAVPAFYLLLFGKGAPAFWPTLAAIVLADIGLAVVGVLVTSLAGPARARDVLLPVLLLPISIPLVIAAVSATIGALPGGDGSARGLGFLALYDSLFAVLGWGVYEHLTAE